MSWEAFRWTAKSPSELYHVLGPHGVDDLIRQTIAAVWRDLPNEGRTFRGAVEAARAVFDRNIDVWKKIKQPGPEAFFADLQPYAADGFFRQAMVLTWMMMPRTGGREVKDAVRIVTDIFERNLQAWEDDDATFTGGKKKSKAKTKIRAAATKKGKATMERPTKRARPSTGSANASGDGTSRVKAPKVASRSGPARAKADEVAPLRAEMDRKLDQAGRKGKSSAGKNG